MANIGRYYDNNRSNKKLVNSNGIHIALKAWRYPHDNQNTGAAVKLMPTASPDGFVVKSVSAMTVYPGWEPTSEGILVEDWVTVW